MHTIISVMQYDIQQTYMKRKKQIMIINCEDDANFSSVWRIRIVGKLLRVNDDLPFSLLSEHCCLE